ncbi:MAG: hypothetical protein GWP67_14325 [Gammaproteobacteria bacterium]|nr:hypothetical protein [Gammaproteobacteria bacterium]
MKAKLKVILLAAVFVLWGCASVLDEDGALAIAPYDIKENGRIVIEAQVNAPASPLSSTKYAKNLYLNPFPEKK